MPEARVYIATTNGAVRIQSIGRETPVDGHNPSSVCLNGGTERLSITKAYTYFVRDHIRRLSNHTAYRVDLDARITGGESWMLGFWIAHALMEAGHLCRSEDAPATAVFTTGAIRYDATLPGNAEITSVGHLEEKLEALQPSLKAEVNRGSRILFFLPDAMEGAWRAHAGILPENIVQRVTPVFLKTPNQSLKALGITEQPLPSKRSSKAIILGALLAVLIGAGFFLASGFPANWIEGDSNSSASEGSGSSGLRAGQDEESLAPDQTNSQDALQAAAEIGTSSIDPINVVARIFRPSDGGTCQGMRFRSTELSPEHIEVDLSERLVISRSKSACHIAIELHGVDAESISIERLDTPDGDFMVDMIGDAAIVSFEVPLYRSGVELWSVGAMALNPSSADALGEERMEFLISLGD